MTTEKRFQGFRGFRWTVCALLFVATTINYMDRQVLGIIAPTLEKALGWNEIECIHIVMAFQAAYALGLLVFVRLVDVIGTRHGYAISIFAWSLAAMAHALARGVLGFGVARFALGLGEAGNFHAALKTVAEWFPSRERALATGLFNSGSDVGAILAPLIVPWITLHYGWQMAFIVPGATGFVWLIFWYWLYALPTASDRVSPEKLAHIHGDPPEPALEKMTTVGSIGEGWLSGSHLKRGWSVSASRKTALLICTLCVVPVVFAAKASNLWVATCLNRA